VYNSYVHGPVVLVHP